MAKSQVNIEREGRHVRISILNDQSFVDTFQKVFNENGFVTWARGALRLPDENTDIINNSSVHPITLSPNGYGVSLYTLYRALTAPKNDAWRAMSWVLSYDFARDARNEFPTLVNLVKRIFDQITTFVGNLVEEDRRDGETLEFEIPEFTIPDESEAS